MLAVLGEFKLFVDCDDFDAALLLEEMKSVLYFGISEYNLLTEVRRPGLRNMVNWYIMNGFRRQQASITQQFCPFYIVQLLNSMTFLIKHLEKLGFLNCVNKLQLFTYSNQHVGSKKETTTKAIEALDLSNSLSSHHQGT